METIQIDLSKTGPVIPKYRNEPLFGNLKQFHRALLFHPAKRDSLLTGKPGRIQYVIREAAFEFHYTLADIQAIERLIEPGS